MAKRILVTGIGGNVGQGVIRNVRNTTFDIVIIGTNITAFSAGNHLCDVFYEVPYAYDESYLKAIKKIVESEKIDLIIPTTDYEVYYLSKFIDKIPCEIVVSEFETASFFLDKYLTANHLDQNKISFAKSFLPSTYNNGFSDIILKPRKGRGSRGIQINPLEYKTYSDEEYMIQELHKGKEITVAFYVTKTKNLHGFIALERVLENGMTTHCKVISDYNEKLETLLLKLIKASNIKGAANLQAIVNTNGDIIPFEINCRISGTNSIRSNFGFEDVKYTLQEWLFNKVPDKPNVREGVATRILMDVIYTDVKSFEEAKDNSAKSYIY